MTTDITDTITSLHGASNREPSGWTIGTWPPAYTFLYTGPPVVDPILRVYLTIDDLYWSDGYVVVGDHQDEVGEFRADGTPRIFADQGAYWWDAEDVTDPLLGLGSHIIDVQLTGDFTAFTVSGYYIIGYVTKVELIPPSLPGGVLFKDWTFLFVKAGTVVTQPTTTTATYTITEPHLGNTIPVVANYPTTAANISSPGVRLATSSEVSALKAHLYGGVAEPMQTTLFNQLHYSGEYGKPLLTYSTTSYISVWYGEQGLGFYVFIGYNSDDYPTQEIEISSIQRV